MSARVVIGLIIIWTVICASGAGYGGGQLGYEVYGWVGAAIGAVLGAIIGTVVGGFVGLIFFGWTEISEKEESWKDTLAELLGAILGLLALVGVGLGINYLSQNYEWVCWIIAVPIFLIVLIIIFSPNQEKNKSGPRMSSRSYTWVEVTDKESLDEQNKSEPRTSSKSYTWVKVTDKKLLQEIHNTKKANSSFNQRDWKPDLRDWKPNFREYERGDWLNLILTVVILSLGLGFGAYLAGGWNWAVLGGIFGGVVSGIGLILQKTPGGRRWS